MTIHQMLWQNAAADPCAPTDVRLDSFDPLTFDPSNTSLALGVPVVGQGTQVSVRTTSFVNTARASLIDVAFDTGAISWQFNGQNVSGGNCQQHFLFRFTETGSGVWAYNSYAVLYDLFGFGFEAVGFYKITPGAPVLIGAPTAVTLDPSAEHTLEIVLVAPGGIPSVQVFVDGVLRLNFTEVGVPIPPGGVGCGSFTYPTAPGFGLDVWFREILIEPCP